MLFICYCNSTKQCNNAIIVLTSGQLKIGSCVILHSLRYEARRKFGEHKRCIRVSRGIAESNSSFLSALQTSQVLHFLMNEQLTHEPIVL